jgi:hypothetical protein
MQSFAQRSSLDSPQFRGQAIPSPPPAIGRHALIRQPHAFDRRARLPEDVDGDAAARIPIAADAQPFRLQQLGQALADGDGAVLVEGAVVAERRQVHLQALGLDQPVAGHIVDDDVGEVGLARHRAQAGELRRREAREIQRVGMRVGDALQHRLFRVGRGGGLDAELAEAFGIMGHGTALRGWLAPGQENWSSGAKGSGAR